jgi:hypothetical protein
MTDQSTPGHNAQPAAPRHVARCPSCGAVLAREPGSRPSGGPRGASSPPPGNAAQAIDNLYREVTRLTEIAELKEVTDRADQENQQLAQERATQREDALQEEIRLLRATVARLRATSRVTGT